MTWADLVDRTALRVLLTKKSTREVLDAFFVELALAVWEHGRITVPGLGMFQVRDRRARRLFAPPGAPREFLRLPSSRAVHCRVAKSWRRRHG